MDFRCLDSRKADVDFDDHIILKRQDFQDSTKWLSNYTGSAECTSFNLSCKTGFAWSAKENMLEEGKTLFYDFDLTRCNDLGSIKVRVPYIGNMRVP